MIAYYVYQSDEQVHAYQKIAKQLAKNNIRIVLLQEPSSIMKQYGVHMFSLLLVENDVVVYYVNNRSYKIDIKQLKRFYNDTLLSKIIGLKVSTQSDIYDLKIRQEYNNLSIFLGIVVNLCLFIGKIVLGLLTQTIALTSDAVNNLSDMLNNVIGYIGMRLSLIPPDKEHPYGHGRIEYIASMFIGMFIILFGFELLKESYFKILNPSDYTISIFMYFILIVSISLKLGLFHVNLFIGRKLDAKTLIAIAKDSLNDVVINIVMIINLVVYQVWNFNVDGYTGAIISLFILYNGYSILKEMVDRIIGVKIDETLTSQIKAFVLQSPYAHAVHDLILHNYGAGNYWGSIHVEVSSDLSILEVHNEFDKIEKVIATKFHVNLVIHLDPIEYMDETRTAALIRVKKVLDHIYYTYDLHDFRFVHRSQLAGFEFEIELEYSAKSKEKIAYSLLEAEIKKMNTAYFIDVKFEYV